MLTYSPVFIAIVALGTILLGVRVSLLRLREQTKKEGSNTLHRAVRLHGNNVEYGGLFAVLLLVMDLSRMGALWVIGAGIAYLVIRLIHGVGFHAGRSGHRAHIIAAGANYIFFLVITVAVILKSVKWP
jgi:uncharacterized membrane protein YecN with MAPEG domain